MARILMPAACLFFGISTIAMLSGFEPFFSFYYSFAWWSYIIFIDSFLYYRGGKSLLFENPRKFLLLLPLSTTVWLVFEALNFRLSNWHYVNIPYETVLRWTGYPVAYSTVLPGIFSTAALLEFLGVLKNSRTAPLGNPQRLYKPFMLAGILFLVLPLVWPEYFFPLVWGRFHIPPGTGQSQGRRSFPPAGMGKGVAAEVLSAASGRGRLRFFVGVVELPGRGEMDIHRTACRVPEDL